MSKKYDLHWSHGCNQERHPENSGGDGLAWFAWDGAEPDHVDYDYVDHEASDEENYGGKVVGWVYVDYFGKVSALFDGVRRGDDHFDGNIQAAFQWCEQQNRGGE